MSGWSTLGRQRWNKGVDEQAAGCSGMSGIFPFQEVT